jgi:hypothetical protein
VLLRDVAAIQCDVIDICSPDMFGGECVVFLESTSPGPRDPRLMAHARGPLSCERCCAPLPDPDVSNLRGKRFCSLACKYLAPSIALQEDAVASLLSMSFAPGTAAPSVPLARRVDSLRQRMMWTPLMVPGSATNDRSARRPQTSDEMHQLNRGPIVMDPLSPARAADLRLRNAIRDKALLRPQKGADLSAFEAPDKPPVSRNPLLSSATSLPVVSERKYFSQAPADPRVSDEAQRVALAFRGANGVTRLPPLDVDNSNMMQRRPLALASCIGPPMLALEGHVGSPPCSLNDADEMAGASAAASANSDDDSPLVAKGKRGAKRDFVGSRRAAKCPQFGNVAAGRDCEHCARKNDGRYGSGRFCSRVCSYAKRAAATKLLVLAALDCETCGRKHDGKFGSGRFCSMFCAKRTPKKHIKAVIGKRTRPGLPLLGSNGTAAADCDDEDLSPKRMRAAASLPVAPQSGGDMRIRCGLCRGQALRAKAVLHPVLTQQPFRLCWKCGEAVVERLRKFTTPTGCGLTSTNPVKIARVEGDLHHDQEEDAFVPRVIAHDTHGHPLPEPRELSKETDSESEASRGTLEYRRFLAVVDEILYMSSPSDLIGKGVPEALVRRIRTSAAGATTTELDIPIEMLSIMRLMFARLGLCFDDGKLSWPLDGIEMPSEQDIGWIVDTALPRTVGDRARGVSAGVRVWNSTFPSTPWSTDKSDKLGSREIYGLLLGLVGISLAPPRRSSSRHAEIVHLDPVSISMAMHNAFDRAEDLEIQALFDSRQLVVPRALSRARQCESEAKLFCDPRTPGLCSCCGSLHDSVLFPFRLVACGSCSKSFCMLCLSIVFGVVEYDRACRNVPLKCQPCRMASKLLAVAEAHGVASTGQRPSGKLPAANNASLCSRSLDSSPLTLPLLVIASPLVAVCLGLRKEAADAVANAKQKCLSFAVFCQFMNDKAIAAGSTAVQSSENYMCIVCRSSVPDGVKCCVDGCDSVSHASCILADVSTDAWRCGGHVCSVCIQVVAPSDTVDRETSTFPLAKCRICMTAFCESHLPDMRDIHVYSEQYITCPECTAKLEAPKLSAGYLAAVAGDGADYGVTAVGTLLAYLRREVERRARRIESYASLLRGLIGGDDIGAVQFAQSLRKKKTMLKNR